MCDAFETFEPPLGCRYGSHGVTRQADDDWFSSLNFLMNLMWYAAMPSSPTGSDTTLNADGNAQTSE
jgi:hypothetical protein